MRAQCLHSGQVCPRSGGESRRSSTLAGEKGIPARVKESDGNSPTACTVYWLVASADQHLNAPVARKLRIAKHTSQDLMRGHACLGQRVTNGVHAPIAQILVAWIVFGRATQTFRR